MIQPGQSGRMRLMTRIRAIIDSDALDGRSLVSFLEASALNQAVIPDIVGMEAYRGDASVNLRSKFAPRSSLIRVDSCSYNIRNHTVISGIILLQILY